MREFVNAVSKINCLQILKNKKSFNFCVGLLSHHKNHLTGLIFVLPFWANTKITVVQSLCRPFEPTQKSPYRSNPCVAGFGRKLKQN